MISVKNVTKIYKTPLKTGHFIRDIVHREYKTYTALKKISFDIHEDELVGFIGPNGAGKTTTMKILSGILYPNSGSINILGFTPFEKKSAFLKQIAFIMGQKNQLLWELPAMDSFTLNKTIYEMDDTTFKKNVSELIELLQCGSFINQPVKTLSLGQRMRVELIASLLHEPKILFLDEPTIGLDIFAQTLIIDFIKEYQQRHKAIIMLTSHYMKDVERLANRIILINQGSILFDNSLERLVSTFARNKKVTIQLKKKLKEPLHLPNNVKYNLEVPVLSLDIPKQDIIEVLPMILKQVEFLDISVEDESLEDIIKSSFSASENTA